MDTSSEGIIVENKFVGHGIYNYNENSVRFLCEYRQNESKKFDWSPSQADINIIKELHSASKACFVIANGQPKVHGYKDFEKEFINLLKDVKTYYCNYEKSKVQKLSDALFGNECDTIFTGKIKAGSDFDNPASFGFTPFWTFVFMDSSSAEITVASNDALKNDRYLLSQDNVLAVLHIDRVANKISACVKTKKYSDHIIMFISKFFFLSIGVVKNIYEISIFHDAN